MKALHRRCTAGLAAITLLGASLPLPAQAGPVATHEVVAATDVKSQVHELLARADVRAALAEQGVEPSQVAARVDALSADEARELAARIDALPAGAGADILGVLLAVFVILLITDILGLTKIFPFTRPIR